MINKNLDKRFDDFNSSISFDCRMYREDISVSIAHAEMLGKCGIISDEDCDKITKELKNIRGDIESGKLPIDHAAEDIHMFVEAELTERIGDAGKRLHTARSRNDQVATGLRLYLRRESSEIKSMLCKLNDALKVLVENGSDMIMPGYTHLQRAQPVTFAIHIGAYIEMFNRDIDRLIDAVTRMMGDCPLGSGALAGTTYPINRELTANALNFDKPCANTIDGVSDRDFCIEIVSVFSIIMMHLSRFSEEIILWCSREFGFIEIDNAFATGSSIMPQKKNPDAAELIRGKSGRVFGDLQALLTLMKGLPLAYNKDMQETQQNTFDAVDTVKACLEVFVPMISSLKISETNTKNMRKAVAKGFLNATDCADYLVRKGMAFRAAYRISADIVAFCGKDDLDLENLPLEEYRKFSDLFDEDIYDAVNLENCVTRRAGSKINGENK